MPFVPRAKARLLRSITCFHWWSSTVREPFLIRTAFYVNADPGRSDVPTIVVLWTVHIAGTRFYGVCSVRQAKRGEHYTREPHAELLERAAARDGVGERLG